MGRVSTNTGMIVSLYITDEACVDDRERPSVAAVTFSTGCAQCTVWCTIV